MAKVSLRAYNREIEAMIDRNHLDEAIANCHHIFKTYPKHLETYRLLGKAYLEYKRFKEAVDVFSRVLVSEPNDFVANVGMSIIRDDENKLDDAIWHMERAFETQPSNAAIQSELQRWYGRRDGVQPPRIRMTRGALAHMYVQGELYPQAISEIKSVLKEDPSRNDMQVLLARAYYRSGLKNDAAEVASALLRTDPYNLDANRVLVEILGTDHPESVQAYRQRIVELDPYAAQVPGSIFLSDEVPDVAVSLERLDWNGQQVGMQPDWGSTQAIALESGDRSQEQPDWLRGNLNEMPPLSSQPAFDQSQGMPASPFDAAPPSAKPAEPVEDIPDFLRSAGWGQSTGAFDESKAGFTQDEPVSNEGAITPGDLPDWVKAMAPSADQPAETPAEEAELPDWINKIGTTPGPQSSESNDQSDWMNQLGQPAAQPVDEQPDWMNQLNASELPAAPAEDQPDWLKGFESESASSVPSTGELDWLSQLGEESKASDAPSNEFDFLNQPVTQSESTAAAASSDELDFLRDLESQSEVTSPNLSTENFDFLNELTAETEQLAPSSSPESSVKDNLGMSAEEQDDSFAWLENLAAKQGATEGLLTQPEERLEEEPDWVKRAKGMDVNVGQPSGEQPPVTQPAGNLEELGKSDQERDDSFAWLESLAAKQGATEGLLTQPEERLEEEPDWVRQAKNLSEQPKETPAEQTPLEPIAEIPVAESKSSANLEDLGKSEAERDDSFAWLENLAAKQGATEGLLTKPEERMEEEPEWVRQAKDLNAEKLSAPEQPASVDETAAWLRSLDEADEVTAAEPASTKDDTAMWFKTLEKPSEEVPPQPAETTQSEELPAWMQDLEEDRASETKFNIPVADLAADKNEKEPVVDTDWMSAIEQKSAPQPVASTEESAPELSTEDIPSWLSELDKEDEHAASPTAMDADLPAWLRDETGENLAEPTRIEPTRAADWQPVETREPEQELVEPIAEVQYSQPDPEPFVPQVEAPAPKTEPEPVMAQPEVQVAQPEVVSIIEEKIAAVQEQEKPAVPPAPHRERKPKGTGRLTMPFDPVLGQARNELSGNNLSGALESYARLIKKGRFLDEVIYDLRDALYRFPVDVNIWQSLGDAYMRANRLQDALNAYTKAEELLS